MCEHHFVWDLAASCAGFAHHAWRGVWGGCAYPMIRTGAAKIVSPKGEFRGIIAETKKIRTARKCRRALRYQGEQPSVINRTD
jgi:hypothetical protein